MIPIYTSISWSIKENIIYIYSDSGRLTRPVFYVNNNEASYKNTKIFDKLLTKDFNFNQLLIGFNKFKESNKPLEDNLEKFIKTNAQI